METDGVVLARQSGEVQFGLFFFRVQRQWPGMWQMIDQPFGNGERKVSAKPLLLRVFVHERLTD